MTAGEAFNAEIDREARAAKCIVVCWSPAARQSEWVNAEAMIGFEQKKLAACYVAGPDSFSAPTPFNALHTEDLRRWLFTPSDADAGWGGLLHRIGRLCGRADIENLGRPQDNATRIDADRSVSPRPSTNEGKSILAWLAATAVALTALVVLLNSAGWQSPRLEEADQNPGEEISNPVRNAPSIENETLQTQSPPLEPVRVGQEFDDCGGEGWCPRMVVVPSGGILMGDDAYTESRPSHVITVNRFAVAKFEVTFAEWDECVQRGGCNRFSPGDEGWGRGRRPVINVSWADARDYVSWLSRETHRTYRLLSEAEWEFAARGFSTSTYYTGASFSPDQGNVLSSVGQTQPVGSYAPNSFGLHDVLGNVQEWVQDCWNDNYVGAPEDGSAWVSDGCTYRVVRGGSWLGLSSGGYLASGVAERNRAIHTAATSTLGFRVARALN